MNLLDLLKATIVCAGIAFLVYSFPVLSQAMIIAALFCVWLSYAVKTIERLCRRWQS